MEKETLRWYVAQTHDGMGNTAARNLKRQNFTHFLPVINEIRRGEKVSVQLFPGYIFVRFDPADSDVRWQAINSTRGVIKLLPLSLQTPLPLPVGFVEEFQARIEAGELDEQVFEEVVRTFLPGEVVPIAAGAFAGRAGSFLRYRGGSLVVLMDLLAGKIKVEVPAHQISRSTVQGAQDNSSAVAVAKNQKHSVAYRDDGHAGCPLHPYH